MHASGRRRAIPPEYLRTRAGTPGSVRRRPPSGTSAPPRSRPAPISLPAPCRPGRARAAAAPSGRTATIPAGTNPAYRCPGTPRNPDMSIVENRKALHDYFIEERFEAGLALEGWEVKSIRAGRVQLAEAYVILRNEQLFLIGCHISALPAASTHVHPDPVRTRKLLMHNEEMKKLIGKVERAGYTLVPLNLHYRGGWIKLELGLAKGKKKNDKRGGGKNADGQEGKKRILRA